MAKTHSKNVTEKQKILKFNKHLNNFSMVTSLQLIWSLQNQNKFLFELPQLLLRQRKKWNFEYTANVLNSCNYKRKKMAVLKA